MTSKQESALHRMIGALETVDGAALGAVLTGDVRLRASLPRRDIERAGRAEVADAMLGWYRDGTGITRVHAAVDRVGEVWHAAWRFSLQEAGEDLVVEQHAYCSVTDDGIDDIRMICSGFVPPGESVRVVAELHARGDGCATLTPRIAAAMRGLQPGAVLAVISDDPEAPDGIAAWSRMTGHALLSTAADPDGTRYLLRHR